MSWRYRVSFVKVKVLCLGFQKRTTKSVVKLYLQHYCRSMQILECEPGRIAYNTGLHKGCFYKVGQFQLCKDSLTLLTQYVSTTDDSNWKSARFRKAGHRGATMYSMWKIIIFEHCITPNNVLFSNVI